MPAGSGSRIIRVFVASPSDVRAERDALAKLVRDVNDVLAFLANDQGLSLELVRSETHAYPDVGKPQDVINRQIPLDYDIFVGVMWKRCGTPTANYPSGTVEEFHRAFNKRQSSHLPRIMFYFCDHPMPIPNDEAEVLQLSEVVKFRDELSRKGLTETYATHEDFGEQVRGGLLRAIRDILREESRGSLPAPGLIVKDHADPAAQAAIMGLAAEYDQVRSEMPKSPARTRRMNGLVSQMKSHAAGVAPMLTHLMESDSAGLRLAAIAVLQMFPDPDRLEWLAGRLDNPEVERPFIGYMAAVALLEAVRALPASNKESLKKSIAKARTLAAKLPEDSDRLEVLSLAFQEFDRRFGRTRIKPTSRVLAKRNQMTRPTRKPK
jgi:hypothetical protein